jgi:hypothetical protein
MSVTVYYLTWCNTAEDLRKISHKLVALSTLKFVRNRNQNFRNSIPLSKQQKKSTKARVTNFLVIKWFKTERF